MHDLRPPVRLSIGRLDRRVTFLLGGMLGALFATGQPAQALVINVTYPHPGDVPAAAMTEINRVISFVDSSFINPVTDDVTVDFTSTCSLGCSGTAVFFGLPYTSWRSAMIADSAANPQNTFLSAAVATLPAADPIGNGRMGIRTADAKAIGFASFTGGIDSNLTFNNSSGLFEFTGVAAPGQFDFGNVFEHELDQALGIGSTLTGLGNNSPVPTIFEPEDYSRYSSTPGVRNITTDPTAAVFFSYDGSTDVAQFNQTSVGDRNDWIYANAGCPPSRVLVQNAFGCPDTVAPYGPGTPEFAVLETLGYDPPAPITEPGTLALLGTSLLALAALRRRPT